MIGIEVFLCCSMNCLFPIQLAFSCCPLYWALANRDRWKSLQALIKKLLFLCSSLYSKTVRWKLKYNILMCTTPKIEYHPWWYHLTLIVFHCPAIWFTCPHLLSISMLSCELRTFHMNHSKRSSTRNDCTMDPICAPKSHEMRLFLYARLLRVVFLLFSPFCIGRTRRKPFKPMDRRETTKR